MPLCQSVGLFCYLDLRRRLPEEEPSFSPFGKLRFRPLRRDHQEVLPMAGDPSSEDKEHKAQEGEAGEKPSSPGSSKNPEAPSEAAATSFPVPTKGTAIKTSGLETLAIPFPLTPNSPFFSDGTHGVVDCRSFSQLLAGAMASPSGNSRSTPILALPIDGMRLPVVAVPCIIAPAALLDSPGFAVRFFRKFFILPCINSLVDFCPLFYIIYL